MVRTQPGFNSILVRLKVIETRGEGGYIIGFNSILVRLKGQGGGRAYNAMLSFNSILVRLKGKNICRMMGDICVSIPYWSD